MFNDINNILILSPHTDDAELGCGGAISRFVEEKKNILWVVFSSAEESLPPDFPANTLITEFNRVIQSLELNDSNYRLHNFKVRKLSEKRQEVLEELVFLRNHYKPDLVIGPSLNDFHQDHEVVAKEMIRAFKTTSSIINYELPWNHVKFDTQLFINLKKKNVDKKIELLQFYKSQFLKDRHYFSKDFIKGLANTRGAQIGEKYAEAFEVVRWRV